MLYKPKKAKLASAIGFVFTAVFGVFGLFTLTPHAFAQCDPGAGGINLADCLKLSDDQEVSAVYENPSFLVNLIVRNLFVLAGIALFILVIVAGFKFFKGTKQGAEEGAKMISTAVLGFIIMFAAYWVVQLVEYLTGANIVL